MAKYFDPDTGEEISRDEWERAMDLEEQYDDLADYDGEDFSDYDSFEEGEY